MDGLDFEAIETAARRKALCVAARAIERRFNSDTSDHVGPTLACRCGQRQTLTTSGRTARSSLR